MIKEILILLWILIIPLVISIYQIARLFYGIFESSKKDIQSTHSYMRFELYGFLYVLKKMSGVIIFIPLAMIFRSGMPFTKITILTGLLAGEIIAFDLMTLAFYFDSEKNILKKFFVFLFVFTNFWISALWAMQGELSLTVLWTSVLSYPIFGLAHILPYFLYKGKFQ